ncbi:MAG: Omp28-related outer membrane protein [Muribaculaceae bacterium]|nr:Omp28-related outer membrane protein [Muribaculaceae bacterium]
MDRRNNAIFQDSPEIEEYVPFSYNVKTKEFSYLSDVESYDTGVFAICSDGTLIGCTPYAYPVRTIKIRKGAYWYNLDLILKEKYGIDFSSTTGLDVTGVPSSVSSDNMTLAAIANISSDSYVIKFNETILESITGVNLLTNYSISPVAGSTFSKASTFLLTFEKEAKVLSGAASKVGLYCDGKLVAKAISVKQSSQSTKIFQIGFIPQALEAGKRYDLKIESGCFGLDNSEDVNNTIEISYIGRDNIPVTPQTISIANGSEQSEISYNQPLTIKYDVPLTLVDGAKGYLYQDDNTEPLKELQLAVSTNYLGAYPVISQYLYLGTKYKIVIPAGVVTDAQGNCGNEEITINFSGIYKREKPTVGTTLFDVDFATISDSFNYFLLYDGDKLVPIADIQPLGFDSMNTPWNFSLRDSESTLDYFAGSTSMYNPAGASKDWMTTIQLEIPSDNYLLTWKSQSYKKDKIDVLKVYVWAYDDELTNLTADIISKIETEGDKVYEEVQTPGENEETVAGDWRENSVLLDKYAGKKIYIAFVNENNDQSMIFIDDVKVAYNGRFGIGNMTPEIVAKQSEQEISGYVNILTDEVGAVFNNMTVELLDAKGQVVSTVTESGLSLKKGDKHEFTFPVKLPIELGKVNSYSIKGNVDGQENTITATVKNLAFEPVQRILLEEGTGAWCQNCPLGIVATDNLLKSYPNNFIPIAIHTSSGGTDAYDFSAYCSALGLNAFPSGRINRITNVYSPLTQTESAAYSYTSSTGDKTYMDEFLKEIEEGTEIDVNITSAAYDTQLQQIKIEAAVTPAVDLVNANYRVLFVVLEKGLRGIQTNGFKSVSDPILGDWGKGGKYSNDGGAIVTYNHVARAVVGNNINGTAGLIPTTMKASVAYSFDITVGIPESVSKMENASVVCVIINANTGLVTNAVECAFEDATSVEGISNDTESIGVSSLNGNIVLTFQKDSDAQVTLYSVNGMTLSNNNVKANAGETLTISANGYQGIAIVKIETSDGVNVEKMLIK